MPDETLYADLATKPPADRALFTEEIQGLKFLYDHPACPVELKAELSAIIDLRQDKLRTELRNAPVWMNAVIRREVHHQFRARYDVELDKLVIEQWVPALNYWLTSGLFPPDTPAATIVAELRKCDPRFKTPEEQLAEIREKAARNAIARDKEGDEKVAAAVDRLSRKGITQFLEVERAVRSGETIIAHGDDEKFLDRTHAATIAAAGQGDAESISVLSHGVRDNVACLNPGHNPVRGR